MRVVVIGGGPGGTEVAMRTARAGHQVTVIERDRFGGTCTNYGCISTKFLLAAAAQARAAGGVNADAWRKIQARKKALVDGLSRKIESDLTGAGVTVLKGKGKLTGPRGVSCTREGSSSALEADVIVLASGSATSVPPGFEVDGRRVLTSAGAMSLKEIPPSVAIVGSGFIGSEFAHLFLQLGSEVTVVEALPHILPAEDEDTAAVVQRELERRGARIITGAPVRSVKPDGEGASVALEDGRLVAASLAVVSIGRKLNSGALGLEKAGLAADARGAVSVNPSMETAVPHIYAVGDLTGHMMLAHVATIQGMVASARISGAPGTVDYRTVPYAVFVSPEVATAGLTEQAARAAGIPFGRGKAPFAANIKARIDQEQAGFIKILAENGTGRLIGGTIVGPRASEMIHTLSTALQAGFTADQLAHGIFVHPTLSESFREAAENIS